jgi:predicted metal-dependent hydrolase
MITKEGFIQATDLEPERAEKLYNQLKERFDGDWKQAEEYLKNVVAYLKQHQ